MTDGGCIKNGSLVGVGSSIALPGSTLDGECVNLSTGIRTFICICRGWLEAI